MAHTAQVEREEKEREEARLKKAKTALRQMRESVKEAKTNLEKNQV